MSETMVTRVKPVPMIYYSTTSKYLITDIAEGSFYIQTRLKTRLKYQDVEFLVCYFTDLQLTGRQI